MADIAKAITEVPELTSDQLVHAFKCASSANNAKELKPYLAAVIKERKKRGSKDLKYSPTVIRVHEATEPDDHNYTTEDNT